MKWIDGFSTAVRIDDGVPIISANREGLLSLANHLTDLADEAPGNHIHLDAFNSLEEGSVELIVESVE